MSDPVFARSEWIYADGVSGRDTYVEFRVPFTSKTGDAILRLSCDSVFAAYVDGVLCGFSACADYPEHKYYDEIPIRAAAGDHVLTVTLWYFGADTSTYKTAPAGLIFELTEGDEVLAVSGTHTLSRLMREYGNGRCRLITVQLGYGFLYDNRLPLPAPEDFRPSVIVEKSRNFTLRPRKNLVVGDAAPARQFENDGHVLYDLGRETAGFVSLDFYSPVEQKITVTWGEHIADGGVRRIIGGRDFSFEFIARAGRNVYENHLRRIAGRYFEIYAETPVEVGLIGLCPVDYPVDEIPRSFADPLEQKIYDVSVRTLRLCMHEHYEDCPWREQALYTMDSRNQMLCGYYAFSGTEYQRANLELISHGQREDGLLDLCYPCGNVPPIPFFSLAYILEVCEYISHTGDREIMEYAGGVMRDIVERFIALTDENHLIPSLPEPYWNFYEWAPGSTGHGKDRGKYDLILNCMFLYITDFARGLIPSVPDADLRRAAIREKFYDPERRIWKLSDTDDRQSQLGLASVILADLGGKSEAETMLRDPDVITATLSMRGFVYDALLKISPSYLDTVLADIRERYGRMLASGATSFWETEAGEADFHGAGSLCHGWSALPVYYLCRYRREAIWKERPL